MSRSPHLRPVAIVTGMLGAGKTTMIRRMLLRPAMADTLVLVNEFGEIGLDHHLLKTVTDAVVLLPNGCLCCTVKEDVVQTLRDVRRNWLRGAMPDVGRVLIETTGLAEPAPLIAAIAGDPLLVDIVELAAVSTVVDAEHAARQVEERPTCRNQIRLADHLLLSKGDLVGPSAIAALATLLGALNPLATVGRGSDVEPDRLFTRDLGLVRRSPFACDEASDHVAGLSTVLLRPNGALEWRQFQVWLGGILDGHGDRLLRLKGCLTFADRSRSYAIQAVHHHFYPLVAMPEAPDNDFLVLIVEGPVGDDLTEAIWASPFGACPAPRGPTRV